MTTENTGWPSANPTPTPTLETTLDAWLAAREPAKQWREYEANLRSEVVKLAFPTPVKGTQRFPIPNKAGYKLKLVYGTTYTLGDKDLINPELGEKVSIETQVDGLLDAISSLGNEGPLLAETLVKWKPELSETKYNELNKRIVEGLASETEIEAKRLLDSILTSKPASPQLTLEEPKAS